MKKGTKIALIVGVPLVIGGVAYIVGRKKAQDRGYANSKFGAKLFGVPFGATTSDDEEVVVKEEVVVAPTKDLPKTPFKTKAQGDAFRVWVNAVYPDYAKSIQLDPSGDYDNAYIRKAWLKYGSKYNSEGVAKVGSIIANWRLGGGKGSAGASMT